MRAGGVEIAYERVGDGPLLVFVHGAAEDGRVWQPQLIWRPGCQVGVEDRVGVLAVGGGVRWAGTPGSVSALPV